MNKKRATEPQNAADNHPATIDGTTLHVLPTPPTIHLKTADDVRLEMAKVYRSAKANELDVADATKLVYILSQVGKMIETHDIQTRVEAVERILNQRKKK